ncbi:MAG: hypothetical protein ACRCZJ_07625 [Erysipelotrichaceae bacterium]
MKEKGVESLVEALLCSRESLAAYEQYHKLDLTNQDNEAILTQIGFCTACRRWYRIYEMAGFDVCLNCMHYLR